MITIFNYLISMFKDMLIVFSIFIILRLLYYLCTRKKINLKYELFLMIFITFIISLLKWALTGEMKITNINANDINIIPFKILVDIYKEVNINNNIDAFLISFIGNIIVFIPIGFFIPLLFKTSNKITILIGFLISLFIEINQLFLERKTDIDDLILNTFGVFIGLIIYKRIIESKKML